MTATVNVIGTPRQEAKNVFDTRDIRPMIVRKDTGNSRVFISATFDEVKSQLDLAFNYFIFKGAPGRSKGERLQEIKNKIACLRQGVSEEAVYHDESTGEDFLVIKIDSDIRQDCIQEFVDLNLAEDMTIYIFCKSSATKTQRHKDG